MQIYWARDTISIGSMGSAEPIHFGDGFLEPLIFGKFSTLALIKGQK